MHDHDLNKLNNPHNIKINIENFINNYILFGIDGYKDEDLSFNDFTMGPRNIKNKTLTDKSLAMYINVQPRNEPKSKL